MPSQTNLNSTKPPRRTAPCASIAAAAFFAFTTASAALAQAPAPMPMNMPASVPVPPPPPFKPVSYTLIASESGLKGNKGALRTDVAISGPMQRYDTTVKLPNGNTFHLVNTIDCTTGKLITADPTANIYTVNDISQVRPEILGTGTLLPSYTPDGRGLLFPLPDLIFAAQSGGVTANVTVTDKGMESVGKTQNAHHYTIAFAYGTTGAAQVPYATQTFDVWTDGTHPQTLPCTSYRLLQAGATGAPVGGVTYTVTGDVDKLSNVLFNVPVQIAYDSGGAAGTITYTLDKLSDKAVDPKLFAMPDGKAEQVSADEFGQQERSAIVARIQNSNNGAADGTAGMRTTNGSTTDPHTQGLGVPTAMGE